jgi:hypothetical protein
MLCVNCEIKLRKGEHLFGNPPSLDRETVGEEVSLPANESIDDNIDQDADKNGSSSGFILPNHT